MPDHPNPPAVVEVVAAASVEPAMVDVARELAALEAQLQALRAEAHQLERVVEERRRRTVSGGHLLQQREHQFSAKAAQSRAGHAAELTAARNDAERRVTAARAEAAALLEGMLAVSSNPPRAAPRVVPGPILSSRDDPGAHTTPAGVEEAGQWHEGGMSAASGPAESVATAGPATTMVRTPPPPRVVPSPVEVAPAATWGGSGAGRRKASRPPRTSPIAEALLPILVIAIVVILLLTWLG